MSVVPLLYEGARFVANRMLSLVRRRDLRAAEVVISQNPQMTRVLVRWLSIDARRIITHPNASDPPLNFSALVGLREPVALFVGKLVEYKGVLLALEAFKHVSYPEARLIFVGRGPARARIERRARELGVQDRIEIRGQLPRDEVLRLMNEVSCLLFPSFHDEASFVIAEALSLGLPVVCLDHGGPGAVVRLWPHSLVAAVPPGRPEATARLLAEHVQLFIANPAIHPTSRFEPTTRMRDVLERAYSMALGE